ncbi:hypothetical protein KKA53_02025 [Candidatus Dependentiae bacterium]|nr:hypothetical protein [Candidatus Dependentiae bacterium]
MNMKKNFLFIVFILVLNSGHLTPMGKAANEKSDSPVDYFLNQVCKIITNNNLTHRPKTDLIIDIDIEIEALFIEQEKLFTIARETRCTNTPPLLRRMIDTYTNQIQQLYTIKNFFDGQIQSEISLYPTSVDQKNHINHWYKTSIIQWVKKRTPLIKLLISKKRTYIAKLYAKRLKTILRTTIDLIGFDLKTTFGVRILNLDNKKQEAKQALNTLSNVFCP